MNIKSFLIFSLLLSGSAVYAQEAVDVAAIKKVYPKNELGLFGETSFGNTNNSGPAGIMYKRWVKPNIAYRLNIAYGEYNGGTTYNHIGISGDTVIDRYHSTIVPTAFLGGGIEVQKKFYKKVYLYAAFEARVGYGSGTTQDEIVRSVTSGNSYYHSTTPTGNHENVTYFSLDAIPSVGAKLQFNRLSLGTDITAISSGYENIHNSRTGNMSTINMDAGVLRQRLYLLYRFK